jgi:uncharacterized protein (DUF427 family)
MTDKPVLTPGPDHPITVEAALNRVVVTFAGNTIADSKGTLALREASYPARYYIPREDVDLSMLERTEHETYCPFKGDAAYYSIRTGDDVAENVVWTYEQPYPAVAEIKDHLAFYPGQVEISEKS